MTETYWLLRQPIRILHGDLDGFVGGRVPRAVLVIGFQVQKIQEFSQQRDLGNWPTLVRQVQAVSFYICLTCPCSGQVPGGGEAQGSSSASNHCSHMGASSR